MDTTILIDYLKVADRYYTEEKERVEKVLTWDGGQDVLKAFRREMLLKPQDQLLNKGNGLKEFLEQLKFEDIKLLYKLYKEEPDYLKPIGEQMKRFIIEEGKKLLKLVGLTNSSGKELGIKEILQESGIISKLIKMLDEFTQIVQECFEGNTSFEIQRS